MSETGLSYMWSPWLDTKHYPWEQVLHLGNKKQYTKNCVILESGGLVTELYYLQKGTAKFVSINAQGGEKIIWYITSGNVFGEVPFVDAVKTDSYFVTEEDCIVYTFTKQTVMEDILPHYPAIMENLLYTMSQKIRILTGQINDLSLNTPKMRVYKMLYHLFSTNNNKGLCVSQQELANLLGIHRVTLNQILTGLRKQGIIQQDRNIKRIVIDKPTELLRLIEQEQS